ncbi:MAG: hypothetical protein HZA15_14965 [Nitrospirae bacterium]|nr:hypothetical protein [Nitrospirota bacterium]
MEIKQSEKKLLLKIVPLLLIAGYLVYFYMGNAMALKDMHGAEWITSDAQGRLCFVYHGDVYRFDPAGDSLTTLIRTGVRTAPGDVMDITLGPAGDILLTEPRSREIRIYTPEGTLSQTLPGSFRENAKIAADDKRIYLADMQGNRVIALDRARGNILWENTGYIIPDAIDLRNNIVYVSDEDKNMVRMLAAEDGHVIKDIQMRLSGYTFGSAVLALSDEALLLAQAYSRDGLLQKYFVTGSLMQTIKGPDGFMPADMTVTPSGEVIVTDDTNYTFYRVQNDGLVPMQSEQLRTLFEGDLAMKSRLKSNTVYSRLLLLGCAAALIGILVYHQKTTKESEGASGPRYGSPVQQTAIKSSPTPSQTVDQEVMTIKPKQQNISSLLLRLLLIIPIGIVLILNKPHHTVRYWGNVGIFVMAASVICITLVRELSARRRGADPNARFLLKLTPQGFYVGDTLHAWHTIASFGVQGSSAKLFASLEGMRVVYWKYKPGQRKAIMRFLAGYDAALEPRYEMEPGKIAEHLNNWKTKYTGQNTEIEKGRGLNRNLTAKDVVLLIGTALLIFGAAIALVFVFGGK